MSEKPAKPGAIADAEALSGSDAAQARVRAWWRLVPRVLTRPTEVFIALRNDDEIDVDARSEPILAIVIVAGMAAMLLTPAWGTLLDEESLDWLVLAVVTFIGGLFYGASGYFLLGLVVWLGARGVGVETQPRGRARSSRSRRCRSLSRSSSRVPAIVLGFGTTGSGRAARTRAPGARSSSRSGSRSRVVARAAGARPADDVRLPWRGVAGALALAAVIVAVVRRRSVGVL